MTDTISSDHRENNQNTFATFTWMKYSLILIKEKIKKRVCLSCRIKLCLYLIFLMKNTMLILQRISAQVKKR